MIYHNVFNLSLVPFLSWSNLRVSINTFLPNRAASGSGFPWGKDLKAWVLKADGHLGDEDRTEDT